MKQQRGTAAPHGKKGVSVQVSSQSLAKKMAGLIETETLAVSF
jgi:hypothetical protein